jgi:hypothetical protein
MAEIVINGSIAIEGKLTVNRALVQQDGVQAIVVEGALRTEKYIEEIDDIQTERFSVLGVQVIQESFGSEDKEIVYVFTAEKLLVEPS